MRASVVALLATLASALAHPGLAERAASSCTSNACASALATRTATAKPDCSSFLLTTVTPCAKTVKSTVTVTSTIGCAITSAPAATTVVPSSSAACPVTKSASSVPSYAAGVCSDGGAFSAACGCINVRPMHTTLPASTVTVTTYTTVKATPTFLAKAVSGPYQNYYVEGDGGIVELTSDIGSAEKYVINSNGTVLGQGGTAGWASYSENCFACYNPIYESSDPSSNTLICKLGSTLQGDGYLSLTCKAPAGATKFQTCSPDGNSLDIGGTPDKSQYDCFTLNLGAYPVCS